MCYVNLFCQVNLKILSVDFFLAIKEIASSLCPEILMLDSEKSGNLTLILVYENLYNSLIFLVISEVSSVFPDPDLTGSLFHLAYK